MAITRFGAELGAAGLTGAVAIAMAWNSMEFGIAWTDAGPDSGFFPFYISLILLFSSACIFLQACLKKVVLEKEILIEKQNIRPVVIFFVSLVIFAGLCFGLGMYVGTLLYLGAAAYWQGKLSPLKSLILAFGVTGVLYVCFEYFFMLPLPKGPILNALGIY